MSSILSRNHWLAEFRNSLPYSYYIIFAELYSVCLRQADVLMVNSTWTKNHINRLLRPFAYRDDAADPEEEEEEEIVVEPKAASTAIQDVIKVKNRSKDNKDLENVKGAVEKEKRFKIATTVYPPCDTISLAALPLELRQQIILSVAQFR